MEKHDHSWMDRAFEQVADLGRQEQTDESAESESGGEPITISREKMGLSIDVTPELGEAQRLWPL